MAPPVLERFPHDRAVIVPPPVSAAVNWFPDPLTQILWAALGVKATAERIGVTVTVTSFDTVALPQVGVDVQTTYHVPAVRSDTVGV